MCTLFVSSSAQFDTSTCKGLVVGAEEKRKRSSAALLSPLIADLPNSSHHFRSGSSRQIYLQTEHALQESRKGGGHARERAVKAAERPC